MSIFFLEPRGSWSGLGFEIADFSRGIDFRSTISDATAPRISVYLSFKTVPNRNQPLAQRATNRETRSIALLSRILGVSIGKTEWRNFYRGFAAPAKSSSSSTIFAGDKPKDNRVPVGNDSARNSEILDRLRVVKSFPGSQPARAPPLGIL